MPNLIQDNSSSEADSLLLSTALLRKRMLVNLLLQFTVIFLVGGLITLFIYQVHTGLQKHGVEFGFGYLASPSGIQITDGVTLTLVEGIPSFEAFAPDMSNLQAYITGLLNTISVVVAIVILSSALGTMLALGRVSTNWVMSKVSFGIIEFVRNTPLLIQVTFWYFAVILNFPPAVIAAKYLNGVIISKQGVFIPSVELNDGGLVFGIGIILVVALAFFMASRLVGKGRDRLVKVVVLIAVLFLVYYFKPLTLSFPTATRFSATGGIHFSAEMVALILGLSVNACAYIAEILRGGLETLPKGQWEAASSLGFNRTKALSNIILPQVFRVVLPSLGNQYISLAKNTSISIAIGYPDLFNVTGTVANQTGRTLEGILFMIIAYLLVSWVISGLTSVANIFVNKAQRGHR